jgi:hypothetical protein
MLIPLLPDVFRSIAPDVAPGVRTDTVEPETIRAYLQKQVNGLQSRLVDQYTEAETVEPLAASIGCITKLYGTCWRPGSDPRSSASLTRRSRLESQQAHDPSRPRRRCTGCPRRESLEDQLVKVRAPVCGLRSLEGVDGRRAVTGKPGEDWRWFATGTPYVNCELTASPKHGVRDAPRPPYLGPVNIYQQ